MAVVYILYSNSLDKYYVGSTKDIFDRLQRHNRGTEKFTSTGIPWLLKYTEEFEEIANARRRESKIKKKKSRKYLELLIQKSVE